MLSAVGGLSKKLARAGQVQASLLDCRLLIAPCNLNNVHWVLVIADLRLKRLIYVDPAGVSCIHWMTSCPSVHNLSEGSSM